MSRGRGETQASERRTPAAPREEQKAAQHRPQIYLRTVYPLNPGIPHFVDFPRGWD